MPHPLRKSIRLPAFDYGANGAYFVTVVSCDRRPLFGSIYNNIVCLTDIGALVWAAWEATFERRRAFTPGAFIVMPDHWHGIVHIDREEDISPKQDRIECFRSFRSDTLAAAIKGLKASVTSAAARDLGFTGTVWQRGYYERVIRDARAYRNIDAYIRTNPSRP